MAVYEAVVLTLVIVCSSKAQAAFSIGGSYIKNLWCLSQISYRRNCVHMRTSRRKT